MDRNLQDPARPRIRPRRRSAPSRATLPGGTDATWIELGTDALRLRSDDGGLLGSLAWPDAQAGPGALELAARDLEALDRDDADEGGPWR